MITLDDRQLNELANRYSQNGDEQAFNELVGLLQPKLRSRAERQTFGKVTSEELESAYLEAVWRATDKFDMSRGNFSSRLNWLLRQQEIALIRYHRASVRNFTTVSIHDPINEQDNGGTTYADILPSRSNVEEESLTNDIKKLLAGFARTYEQHGKAIQLLALGCTNEEIARGLGATSYDANTRQTVSRARKNFQKYLTQQLGIA